MSLLRLAMTIVLLTVIVRPWTVADSEESLHADSKRLEAATEYIRETKTHTHAFIVRQKSKILVEEYFDGYDESKLHEIQSATKSISSLLIGIALDHGHIKSVDQPLIGLLPEHSALLVEEKKSITLKHVLTMTTGLQWHDWRRPPNKPSSFEDIANVPDSVRYVLSQPLVTKPGQVFFYNTGSSHLLSAIVQSTTGMTTAKFAEKHLFKPLGITEYDWPVLADGIHQGGWGMRMRPVDMARLGQLVLDGGSWGDKQIVSKDWVDESTRRHVAATGFTGSYGFHWWVPDEYRTDTAAALGYGGQDIFVFEKLDLVVVFTGDTRFPRLRLEEPVKILKQYVLPN